MKKSLMISLWMVGILFFKFEEVIIMSLFSMMLGQINSESNIDDLKDKFELSEKLLNAIIIVVTDGKVEPEYEDNRSRMETVHQKTWEKCTVILTRDEWDRSSYEMCAPRKSTIGEIKFEDGSLLYKSDGSALRKGPWVERFLAYSKEVLTEYEKKQQEKVDQENAKKLVPFLDIDF